MSFVVSIARPVIVIGSISGVLKDFLRELPEPLFTNALYSMLLDALSVRLPDDPDGSAKLMLSVLECLPKANQVRPIHLNPSRVEIRVLRSDCIHTNIGPLLHDILFPFCTSAKKSIECRCHDGCMAAEASGASFMPTIGCSASRLLVNLFV